MRSTLRFVHRKLRHRRRLGPDGEGLARRRTHLLCADAAHRRSDRRLSRRYPLQRPGRDPRARVPVRRRSELGHASARPCSCSTSSVLILTTSRWTSPGPRLVRQCSTMTRRRSTTRSSGSDHHPPPGPSCPGRRHGDRRGAGPQRHARAIRLRGTADGEQRHHRHRKDAVGHSVHWPALVTTSCDR